MYISHNVDGKPTESEALGCGEAENGIKYRL